MSRMVSTARSASGSVPTALPQKKVRGSAAAEQALSLYVYSRNPKSSARATGGAELTTATSARPTVHRTNGT